MLKIQQWVFSFCFSEGASISGSVDAIDDEPAETKDIKNSSGTYWVSLKTDLLTFVPIQIWWPLLLFSSSTNHLLCIRWSWDVGTLPQITSSWQSVAYSLSNSSSSVSILTLMSNVDSYISTFCVAAMLFCVVLCLLNGEMVKYYFWKALWCVKSADSLPTFCGFSSCSLRFNSLCKKTYFGTESCTIIECSLKQYGIYRIIN